MSDFIAAFDSRLIENVLRAIYWVGAIPSAFVNTENRNPAIPVTTLEVYFDEPVVFMEPFEGRIVAAVRQFVVVRAADIPDELQGMIRIRIPLMTVLRGKPGEVRQFLRIDVPHLSDDHVQLSGIDHLLYGPMIQGNVLEALRAREPIDIPITPDEFPMLRSRLHLSPIPFNSTSELQLLANLDGAPIDTSGLAPFFLLGQKPAAADPIHANGCLLVTSGFLIGKLRERLKAKSLGPGTVLLDGVNRKLIDLSVGGDVTLDTNIDSPFVPSTITLPVKLDFFSPTVRTIKLLSELSISFHDGFVGVSGRLEVVIDNAPDAEIDITAGIGLVRTETGLKPNVTFVSADFDATLLTALSVVLFGPIGLMIASVLDGMIDSRLADEVTNAELPSIPVPVHLIPQEVELTGNTDPERQVHLLVPRGQIAVVPGGIRYASSIGVRYKPARIEQAPYIRCNTQTFEAHVTGCRFGDMIHQENVEQFLRVEDALAAGYDGCRHCLFAQEGDGSLRVRLDFLDPVGASKKQGGPIRVEARRTEGPDSPYLKELTLEQHMPLKGTKNSFFLRPLADGDWRITVSDGIWSRTIEKSMRNFGELVHMTVERES
jgi:hypothetical protein